MLEINITVSCPDLVKAATLLAAIGHSKIGEQVTAAPVVENMNSDARPAAPAIAPPSAPLIGQTSPTNPVVTNPTIGSPSMTTPGSCPSNTPPVTNVPLAQAPTFTLEQVSKAGADLITAQPAKMQELMGLMAQFGVQTVNALRPDQLGAFATALRGMGAQI